MSESISLKEAERRAFRSTFDDGLWDVFLGFFFLMFAFAPILSVYLGDFWSSAVFLPVWILVYLAILCIRKRIVKPRMGVAKYGRSRQVKMKRFTVIMLVINTILFLLGLYAAANFRAMPGWTVAVVLGLMLLMGFSLSAYFLDFNRLYLYGLLAGFAPLVGEWLFLNKGASHHGYPIVFGFMAVFMVVVGLVVFLRLLRENPLPEEEISQEEP